MIIVSMIIAFKDKQSWSFGATVMVGTTMIIIVVITTYHYDKSQIYKYYHYHDDHPLFSLSLSNIVHVYNTQ